MEAYRKMAAIVEQQQPPDAVLEHGTAETEAWIVVISSVIRLENRIDKLAAAVQGVPDRPWNRRMKHDPHDPPRK